MARPEWVTYSDEEIEEMILKFNREGKWQWGGVYARKQRNRLFCPRN